METLHALLIHPYPGQMNEAPRELGWVIERLPALPELLGARFFRSQGEAHTYLILTTWDPEAGRKMDQDDTLEPEEGAQGLPRPDQLYRLALPGPIEGETEEWFLRYVWGYSRSGMEARHALVLVVSRSAGQENQMRQRWIGGLRALAAEVPIGQVFLARSIPQGAKETEPMFLCYLGCPSEEASKAVREHPLYDEIGNWLSRFAQVRAFDFAPLFPDYRAPG
ncbi:MAG TPA: hypothetical protein VKT82_13230 [Ktedonobacterales bacterium]|nr:hypothetical protein [Ktedonobacterales bacterium]